MILKNSLPKLNAKIRLFHAAPKLNAADIYANGKLLGSDISFGDITSYQTLPPDEYLFEAFVSGTYDKPFFSRKLELTPNMISTICFIENNNQTDLFILKDSNSTGGNEISFLRFLNLSPNAPLMSLSLSNNENLFKEVEYLETTGYYPLSPGIYTFKLNFSGAEAFTKTLRDVVLLPGEFQSLYVIGLLNGEPQLGYLLETDGIPK